jgi:hypothetical protein
MKKELKSWLSYLSVGFALAYFMGACGIPRLGVSARGWCWPLQLIGAQGKQAATISDGDRAYRTVPITNQSLIGDWLYGDLTPQGDMSLTMSLLPQGVFQMHYVVHVYDGSSERSGVTNGSWELHGNDLKFITTSSTMPAIPVGTQTVDHIKDLIQYTPNNMRLDATSADGTHLSFLQVSG